MAAWVERAAVKVLRRVMRQLLDGAEQILWGIVVGWTLTSVGVYLIARWRGELTSKLMIGATLAVWIVSATMMVFEVPSVMSRIRVLRLNPKMPAFGLPKGRFGPSAPTPRSLCG